MRILAAALACLVFASCSSRQIVATDESSAKLVYQQRLAELSPVRSWTLSGKLSIDNGEDGGSGKLSWNVNGSESMMSFRGALGKASWQLESRPQFAQLKWSDGSISEANSVAQLLQEELGWAVPVESLTWWALGIAAPGETDSLVIDDAGRIITMQQDGWDVSYSRYRNFGSLELPGRMDVVNDQFRLKMAVASWTIQQSSVSDE
jgi:outer membrane lipoprotein LolB